MKKTNTFFAALAALTIATGTSHAAATIIFSDNFDGTTANLDSASPDQGTGTWTAAPMFDRNGDVNITGANAGSATLAFTPSNGLVYTLESTFSLSTGGSGDWVGFGFAKGQSTTSGTNNRFLGAGISDNTEGRAWMYARQNTNNPRTERVGGTDNTAWSGFTQSPSNLDLRIVLDTTGGTGTWTATWFAKDSANFTYTKVRDTAAIVNEDFDSVGFAVSGNGVTADITNFSLTSVPEPSTALLGALGALCLLRRRR